MFLRSLQEKKNSRNCQDEDKQQTTPNQPSLAYLKRPTARHEELLVDLERSQEHCEKLTLELEKRSKEIQKMEERCWRLLADVFSMVFVCFSDVFFNNRFWFLGSQRISVLEEFVGIPGWSL